MPLADLLHASLNSAVHRVLARPHATIGSLETGLRDLEKQFVDLAELLFNLHYGPALEQLGEIDRLAESLLAFTQGESDC